MISYNFIPMIGIIDDDDGHQQGLCRFPVLMISWLSSFSRCSQLRHNLDQQYGTQ